MSRAEGKSFLKMFEELKGEMVMPTDSNKVNWTNVSYSGPYGVGSLDLNDTALKTDTYLKISELEVIKAGIEELLNRVPTQHSLAEAILNKLEEFVQDNSIVLKDGNKTQLAIPAAVMLNAIRNLRTMIKVPCGTKEEK